MEESVNWKMQKNWVQCVSELLVWQCGLLQHGSFAYLGSEEEAWGFQRRSSGETRGQEYWQQIVEVKMEVSKEVGNLLDFKISKVEYSKSWASKNGETPYAYVFSFTQSRRRADLFGQIQDID